jgi:hypothetical protein
MIFLVSVPVLSENIYPTYPKSSTMLAEDTPTS